MVILFAVYSHVATLRALESSVLFRPDKKDGGVGPIEQFTFPSVSVNILSDGDCGELIPCCGDRISTSGGQDLTPYLFDLLLSLPPPLSLSR